MPIFAAKALSFAASHWKGVLIALAFAALGLKLMAAQADARHWHKESDRYAGLFHDEQRAFKQTVANFRAATALAQAQDKAHAATVERDQAVISQEVSHDYQIRIADLRTRYDALRLRRAPAIGVTGNRGGGGDPGMSEAASPASGADAPADQEGFPLDDRLTCSLQAEQLDALIDWNEKQLAVPR